MDEINKLSKEKNVTAIALCKAVSMPRATYYRQQKKGTLEKNLPSNQAMLLIIKKKIK
ncbi:hypothetical protein [Piscirickettsia salmonis]|uniref:hypothetical protein n=1 Tax=Piscirickettsia salmonis TaxID=1238 RepID=UPI000AE217CC|nr:hypothetical protein [Piscirickettsia salmonis]